MSRTLPLTLFLVLVLLMGLTCNLTVAKASVTEHSQSSVQYDAVNIFSGNSTSNETQWTGFTGAQGVAIGDLYNNGSEETAVSEGVAGTVTVVESDGKTIAKQFNGLEDPFGVAIGDLYNDGVNVIAIAETGASRVTVCYINGTVVNQFQGLDQPVGVAIGDLYNDHQNVIAISENGSGSVIVLKSDGTIMDNFTGFSQPEGVAIGDFYNDGKNDLAVADSGTNEVYVIDSNGNILMEWGGLGQPMGVAIGDYDNRGLNEIAITETYPVGKVTVYADNGTTVVASWTGRNDPTGVAIGDALNNGKNELVFTEVSQVTVMQELHLTVTITSPENMTYNVSDIPFEFETDLTPSWMGYSLDGQPNATISGNTTLTGLQDGQHSIIVYANDTYGNLVASNPVLFEVDTTPPSITNVVQYPPANNVGPQDAVNINATVADATSGVKQVILNYTVDNGTWTEVTMTNIAGSTWNASIPALSIGTYVNYTISAEDNANNSITTEQAFGYQVKYQVVPEFPTLLLLTLLMPIMAVAVIVHKRKQLAHARALPNQTQDQQT